MAAVIKAEKRKPDVKSKVAGRNGSIGWDFEYRLHVGGSSKICTRTYDFPLSTNRLSDFESNCRYAKTSSGIRVGMSAATAEGLAGHAAEYSPRLGHGCMIEGYAITEQQGSRWLAVWMKPLNSFSTARYGSVTGFSLYGAHSVFWQNCE
jgi:hypothetical protein